MTWVPGEAFLIKLWDTIADRGIAGLLKPTQIRREGRAFLDVRLAEMREVAALEDSIKAARANSDDPLPQIAASPQPLRITDQSSADKEVIAPSLTKWLGSLEKDFMAAAVLQEINVAKAIYVAEKILADETGATSETPIEQDWFERWRDYASLVSSEELQNLWGQLLAAEVKVPGSYSIRTLEFLKALSSQEARDIEKLFSFVVGGTIIRDTAYLNSQGITLRFLSLMQEIGVISGVEAMGLNMTWPSAVPGVFQKALPSHGRALFVQGDAPDQLISLPCYLLTTVGEQILKLGHFVPNEGYLLHVGRLIQELGFKVKLGDAFPGEAGLIELRNLKDLHAVPNL